MAFNDKLKKCVEFREDPFFCPPFYLDNFQKLKQESSQKRRVCLWALS